MQTFTKDSVPPEDEILGSVKRQARFFKKRLNIPQHAAYDLIAKSCGFSDLFELQSTVRRETFSAKSLSVGAAKWAKPWMMTAESVVKVREACTRFTIQFPENGEELFLQSRGFTSMEQIAIA